MFVQEVADVNFRPKLACAFILKLYDAQCLYYTLKLCTCTLKNVGTDWTV